MIDELRHLPPSLQYASLPSALIHPPGRSHPLPAPALRTLRQRRRGGSGGGGLRWRRQPFTYGPEKHGARPYAREAVDVLRVPSRASEGGWGGGAGGDAGAPVGPHKGGARVRGVRLFRTRTRPPPLPSLTHSLPLSLPPSLQYIYDCI